MARRNHDDDDSDLEPRPAKRSKLPLPLLIAGGIAALAVYGLVAGGVGYAVGSSRKATANGDEKVMAAAAGGKVNTGVMMQDELRKAVMGKSKDEVMKLLGKPDTVMNFSDVRSTWFYNNRAKEPITGQVGDAQLVFDNGVVTIAAF